MAGISFLRFSVFSTCPRGSSFRHFSCFLYIQHVYLRAREAGYGGPTETHAFLPGSPAIDTGDNATCPATDQRGVSRPFDGDGDGEAVCDIGAYESHHCLADVNGDGVIDASDVRLVARSMHTLPGSTRWNDAADVNGDGLVDTTDLHAVLHARRAGICG